MPARFVTVALRSWTSAESTRVTFKGRGSKSLLIPKGREKKPQNKSGSRAESVECKVELWGMGGRREEGGAFSGDAFLEVARLRNLFALLCLPGGSQLSWPLRKKEKERLWVWMNIQWTKPFYKSWHTVRELCHCFLLAWHLSTQLSTVSSGLTLRVRSSWCGSLGQGCQLLWWVRYFGYRCPSLRIRNTVSSIKKAEFISKAMTHLGISGSRLTTQQFKAISTKPQTLTQGQKYRGRKTLWQQLITNLKFHPLELEFNDWNVKARIRKYCCFTKTRK